MTTKIKDQSDVYGPHVLENLDNGWVDLETFRPGCQVTATMLRADFLAAVEDECDAIVIDRAGTPVMTSPDGAMALLRAHRGIYRPHTTEEMQATRDYALALLSAVEYLAAHPPVPPVSDEDVETLAGLMDDVEAAVMSATSLARRLLATGRVSVRHE